MTEMQIVDSQIHFYLPDSEEHPWPELFRGKERDQYHFYPEEIVPQMDAAGVHRAIVVPPSWAGDDNRPCLSWAAADPERFAVMGRFDVTDPDRGRIETWLDQPHMIGIRMTGRLELGEWLDLERFDWFWAAAERLRIPVMMLVQEQRIRLVRALAEHHPDLTIIMDHFGTTIGDLTKIDPWAYQDEVLALAHYPKVYAKLSALPLNTLEPFPFKSQTPYIRKAYDVFGPERLAWGTDASRFRRSTYREAVDHMMQTIDFLSDEDKKWIMGKTIATAVRWPTELAA